MFLFKYYKFQHSKILNCKIILTSAKTDFHPGLQVVLRPYQKSVSAEVLNILSTEQSSGGYQLVLNEIGDMQKLKIPTPLIDQNYH